MSNPDKSIPPKADVIASLDYDIERVELKRRRVGTSRWILYAAIAALVWVLNESVGKLQGKNADFEFVIRCVSAYLGILTALLFYAWSYELGARIHIDESAGARIKFFDRELKSIRGAIIAQMLFVGCSVGVAVALMNSGLGVLGWAAWAIQVIWFGSCAVIAAMSYLPVPFGPTKRHPRWQALVFGCCASVVASAGAFSVFEAWRAAPENVAAHNGIALVVVGLVVVGSLLIASGDDVSSTADLVDLRRQLLLGWCSTDEAVRQIELKVLGFQSIDYLSEAVGPYIAAVNAFREYVSTRRGQIESARASAVSVDGVVSPDIAIGLLSVMVNDSQRKDLAANVATAQRAMEARAEVLRRVNSIPPQWVEVMKKYDADVQDMYAEAASWDALLEQLASQSGFPPLPPVTK